jgi:PAS domain S-box-containing protein
VAARAGMARTLSLLASALALGLFLIERFMGVPLDADGLLSLPLAGMGLVAWFLLKTRHYTSVAWLLVISVFAMATASTILYGSVRTADNALFLVGQVAVGIFLGRQALVRTTVGAIVLLGALTWAEASGLLLGQPSFEVGLRTWLMQGACLLAVAVMMYLNRTQMRAAQALHLQEAHQRLKTQLDRDLGKERFTRAFRSSPTPIFVQSARTGAIVDVNPAFERVMGYRRKDMLGKRDGFLWLQDQRYEEFARDRRTALRTAWHAITGLGQDGRQVALQICSEMDEDPEDSLVITAIRVLDHASGRLVAGPAAPESDGASSWLHLEDSPDA